VTEHALRYHCLCITTMTDITPDLNEQLKGRNAPPTRDPSLTLQSIDEFLKEAYRIVCRTLSRCPIRVTNRSQNSHIASLNQYLRGIRQSYLSTSQAPRRLTARDSRPKDKQPKYLTDRQRDEVDAETKQLLRELNSSIRNLADAEQLRQNTELTLSRKKYAKTGLGALGKWAAGGAESSKSYEQGQEEEKANQTRRHRESVLWFLRQRLQECGSFQASMMETRITREMEKNKSVLYKARGQLVNDMGAFEEVPKPMTLKHNRTTSLEEKQAVEEQLSPEQLQMFEQENKDMMKHYQDTLNQVKYVQQVHLKYESS
jgi:syntaxin 18